jgi:hypothetical protein
MLVDVSREATNTLPASSRFTGTDRTISFKVQRKGSHRKMAFVCAASYKNTRGEDSAHRLTKRDRLFPMAAMIRYHNPMSLAVTDAQ